MSAIKLADGASPRKVKHFTIREMLASNPELFYPVTWQGSADLEIAGYPVLYYSSDSDDQAIQREAIARAISYLPYHTQHSVKFAVVDQVLFMFWARQKAAPATDSGTINRTLRGVPRAALVMRLRGMVRTVPPTARHSLRYDFDTLSGGMFNISISYQPTQHMIQGITATSPGRVTEAVVWENLRELFQQMTMDGGADADDIIGTLDETLQALSMY